MKMENTNSRSFVNAARLLISIVMVTLQFSRWATGQPRVTGMFAFGDSLFDNGNNNYLTSLAKANFIPYGIDFELGQIGRFTNGKTMIDLLGDKLGLPYLPPFADPLTIGPRILKGVNFASAAGGILDMLGVHLGQKFSLRQQVINFELTLAQLRIQLAGMNMNVNDYLAKSIAVMAFGSNDYINNYLMPSLYPTRYIYSPSNYADLLIRRYTTQILTLQTLGVRKFLLAGLAPLGCIPNQLAQGKCNTDVNNMVGLFNERLRSLVDQLNANHPESNFAYGNTYGVLGDLLNNSPAYGFMVINGECCALWLNQGLCLPLSSPCPNRNEFLFWDAYHTTQAANEIIAQRAYAGPPSDCYPINVQQLAQI